MQKDSYLKNKNIMGTCKRYFLLKFLGQNIVFRFFSRKNENVFSICLLVVLLCQCVYLYMRGPDETHGS